MSDVSRAGSVGRSLAGGVLLGVVAAAVIRAWSWANDRPECSGEMFACVGEALAVALVGVPAAVTLAWLGLRAIGVAHPALAVTSTFAAAIAAATVLDPPLWAWPVGLGAVGCVSIAWLGALSRPAT